MQNDYVTWSQLTQQESGKAQAQTQAISRSYS